MKMDHPTRHAHESTRRPSRLLVSLLCAALMVGMTGCSKQELYTELSERQANEMVAVLLDAGIDAAKQAKDCHFAILAQAGDFGRAVRRMISVMVAHQAITLAQQIVVSHDGTWDF